MRNIEAEATAVAEEFFRRFENVEGTNANQNDRNVSATYISRMESEVEAYRKLLKTGIVDDLLAM